MEFFERAHVAKNKDLDRKETKSEENMKKQLKQMLRGYKNSDNEAIRRAAELKNDQDDSTSVSGFSDLNITNSSIEGDETNVTGVYEDAATTSEEVDSHSALEPNIIDLKSEQAEVVSVSITSASESEEDLESLSGLPCEFQETSDDEGKSSPEFSLDSSFVEITTDNSIDSDESCSFDTDGALAAEILGKLKKTVNKGKGRRNSDYIQTNPDGGDQYKGPYKPESDSNADVSSEQSTPEKVLYTANKVLYTANKRKLDKATKKRNVVNKNVPNSSSSSVTIEDDEITSDLSECNQKQKHKPVKKRDVKKSVDKSKGPCKLINEDTNTLHDGKFIGPYRPKGMESPDIEVRNSSSTSDTINTDNSYNSQDSSPFVSVNASDMLCESLGDILGDYCHPTIRNLPSDLNSNITSDFFEVEDMNVDDVLIEEDADSLVPEVDDTILDDLEDVPMDTSDIEDNGKLSPELVDSVSNDTDLSQDVQNLTLPSQDVKNLSFESRDNKKNLTLPSQDVRNLSFESRDNRKSLSKELSLDSIDTTIVNVVRIFYTKNCCIFVLKHPTKLFIHGKVKVKCLGGTVEVLGHTLKDDYYEVYAPNYNCAHDLKTVETANAYYGLFGKLTSIGLTVSEAEEIVVSLGPHDGVISLQPLKSRKMDFVEDSFTMTNLFSKLNRNVDHCLKRACEFLGCSLYLTKPWKCFQEDENWLQAVECGMNSGSKAMVCGGKGVGKSTFVRYYVNRLLAKGPLLLIDLDPGQCEFTPAGNISATIVTQPLLGPSFTHLKRPQMMINLGIINTMDNIRRYAFAVNTLITYCSTDDTFRTIPWIVNTMGMTNEVGLKFTTLIISLVKPTHLLQIDSRNPKKNYSCQLHAQKVLELYMTKYNRDIIFRGIDEANVDYTFISSEHLDGGGSNFALAPRDERYLNFLAYFGETLSARDGGLLDIIPYEVKMSDIYVAVNVRIPVEAVSRVLNGKVVALCTSTSTPMRRVFTLDNTALTCHGHGLVRGIDWDKGVLYMITPIGDKLCEVNTLIYADWVPEIRGTENQLHEGASVPYRTASLYEHKHFMFTPKRRFNPLQLLKMSRTN